MNRIRKPLPLAALLASGILIIVTGVSAYCRAIHWQTSFVSGQREAKKCHKRMLVEFYAQWCGPCKKMERTTFQDPEVTLWMNRFVDVRLDVEKNQALTRRYGAGSIPRVLVLTPDGKVLRQAHGYLSPTEFRLFLKQGVPD